MSQWEKAIQFIENVGGVMGLYKGIEAKLLQTILYNAIMMMVYEK